MVFDADVSCLFISTSTSHRGPKLNRPWTELRSFASSTDPSLLSYKPEILAPPNSGVRFPSMEEVLQIPPHLLSESRLFLSMRIAAFVD